MAILLVAHGTRNPHGVRMIGDLAAAMAGTLDQTVRVAFVDVLGPAPDEVLRSLHDEPTVLVPALLSSGYRSLRRAAARRGVPASGRYGDARARAVVGADPGDARPAARGGLARG
jgi:CbiX